MKNKNESFTTPCLESNCLICSWYIGGHKCVAFKDEIPNEIWNGLHDKVSSKQTEPIIFDRTGPIL